MNEKPKKFTREQRLSAAGAGLLALSLVLLKASDPDPEILGKPNFDPRLARHVGTFTTVGYVEGAYSSFSTGDCADSPQSWAIVYVNKGQDSRDIIGLTDGTYEPRIEVYPDKSTSETRAPVVMDGVTIEAKGSQVTMTPLYGEPVTVSREQDGLHSFTTAAGHEVRYGLKEVRIPPTPYEPYFAVQISCDPDFPNQPIDLPPQRYE